jgi:hypothetical protein
VTKDSRALAEPERMGGQEGGIQILPDKILLKIFSYLPHKVGFKGYQQK